MAATAGALSFSSRELTLNPKLHGPQARRMQCTTLPQPTLPLTLTLILTLTITLTLTLTLTLTKTTALQTPPPADLRHMLMTWAGAAQ